MIPLWVIFAAGTVLSGSIMPLIQERMKADGFALAFWNKIFCAVLMIPFVIVNGLPDERLFYIITFLTAILWSISDVVYFRAVPVVGAGVVTRVLPLAVIFGFFLWFFFDHALLAKYLGNIPISLAIFMIVSLAAFFSMRLKHCQISQQAFRLVWFVIFAASVGPTIQKLALAHGGMTQAPYAFVFIQALMMMGFWATYYAIKRPIPWKTMVSGHSIKTGAMVGAISGFGVTMKNFALIHAEHPAYVSVVTFLDSVIILLIYRLLGRKDDSDILSGLGVVACAAALVIVKSFNQ